LHARRIDVLTAEKDKLAEENTKLKAESSKRAPEDVKAIQKHADLAIHLSMEYRKALEVMIPEVEKAALDKSQPETKLLEAPKAKAEGSGEAPQSQVGTKRKAESTGPTPLEQPKKANVQTAPEAPSEGAGSQPGKTPAKEAPAAAAQQ
ncbi:unnamed protein product, partial [Symbiodinium pilosum]